MNVSVSGITVNRLSHGWRFDVFSEVGTLLDSKEGYRTFVEAIRAALESAEFYAANPGARPGRSKPKSGFKGNGWCECLRCGYQWLARSQHRHEPPERCAKCRSPLWNTPRQRRRSEK